MADPTDMRSEDQLNPVRAAAGELSTLYHLYYANSVGLRKPAGREYAARLLPIHPRVAEAAEQFEEGMTDEAANTILALLDSAGVDVEVVAAAEGRAAEVDRRLSMSTTNWYGRAKEEAPVAPKPKDEPTPCLDNTRPSHKHEVWIAAGAAKNDYAPAREWMTGAEYSGKSPAWWLSQCITGLPFRLESYEALSGYLGIKPQTGDPAFRIIVTRRGGKVLILWWGLKTDYNRITSHGNLPKIFKGFSLTPVERLV
jgi:hypothetical protein